MPQRAIPTRSPNKTKNAPQAAQVCVYRLERCTIEHKHKRAICGEREYDDGGGDDDDEEGGAASVLLTEPWATRALM